MKLVKTLLTPPVLAISIALCATLSSFGAELQKFVEYVQTDGTGNTAGEYVLLDYTPTSSSVIEVDFAMNNRAWTSCFFCSRGATADTDTFTSFYINNNGLRWDYCDNSSGPYQALNDNNRHVMRLTNEGLWLDGTKSTTIDNVQPKTFTPANKMMLFASYMCGSDETPVATGNYANIKLYRFRAWDDNGATLKVDLRPCVDTDNVVCLYDLVGKKFYYNLKSGKSFKAGTAEYYVSPGGTGNGSTWESPLGTIEAALAKSDVGRVYLDKGTHELSKKAEISIAKAVTVAGRTGDPADVIVTRPAGDETLYRIFNLNHASAILRDITVSGGRLKGNGCNIYMSNGLVDHCIVEDGVNPGQSNVAGGGIHMRNGRVTRTIIRNNDIGSSATSCRGGGIAIFQGNIDNCLIYGNSGYYGGGIAFEYGGFKVRNCTVADNTSVEYAGAYRANANGGVVQILNCVFGDGETTEGTPDVRKISNYFEGMKGCLAHGSLNDDCLTTGFFAFRDAANGDYRLVTGSVGIDSVKSQGADWTPADLDLAGGSRVVNAIVDAGCYEWSAEATGAEVAIESSATSGGLTAPVNFTSHIAGLEGALTYAWDFGDSTGSSEANPQHTYAAAGDYTVSLKVTDGAGVVHSALNTIAFSAKPSMIEVDGTGTTLAAAVAAVADGGEIVLKASGSPYVMDGELILDRAVTIRGETGDPADVTVAHPGGKTYFRLFRILDSGVVLKDIAISGGQLSVREENGANVWMRTDGLIDHCIVENGYHSNGSGGCGAGIEMSAGRVTRSIIRNNRTSTASAYFHGGGVDASGGQVDNCLVVGNTSYQGSGIYVSGSVFVWNCTVVANTGTTYPGVFRNSGTPQIYNCVIADNTTTGYKTEIEKICNYSDGMKGCLTRIYVNDNCSCGTFYFKDAENGDYRLVGGSDGIDSPKAQDVGWTPADLDLAGGSRVVNSIVDVGCYEWSATAGEVEVMASQDVSEGNAPLAVQFNAHVTGLSDGAAYLWDFGDGKTSTEANPAHTYMAAGLYAVTLSVSDGGKDYPSRNALSVTVREARLELDGTGFTLNEAVDFVSDGGEIVLKASGSPYVLAGEVLATRAMTIRGETGNPDDVIVRRDAADTAHFRPLHIDGAGILVASLTVENGYLDGTANGGNILIDVNGGIVSNCVIRNATANGQNRNGAGIFAGSADAKILRCVITNNTGWINGSSYCGGSGAYLNGGGLLENCLIAHNVGGRGAVYVSGSATVNNCTIVDNTAANCAAGIEFGNKNPRIYNTIIAFNAGKTDALCVHEGGEPACFFNCTADKLDMSSDNGNVYGTPDFTNRAADDYTTSATSCNVGKGSNEVTQYTADSIDLAGNPRLGEGGVLDIGCYQWVLQGLEVSFVADKTFGILPLAVTFTPNVEGATDDYVCQWDLDGDGTFETETEDAEPVQKVYETAGTFAVSLQVVHKGETYAAGASKDIRAYPGAITVSEGESIPAVVAAAGPGTVITVNPGDYAVEGLVALRDPITIRGATGNPADVRITRLSDKILLLDHKGAAAEALTFENGNVFLNDTANAGMIQLAANGGTVSNCVVRNSKCTGNGGVIIAATSPDALITHCVITGNTTSMSGLRGYWCGPVVQISGGGVLAHSLVAQNKGTGTPNDNLDFGFGGVSLYGSSKAIHCTIADNEGDKCAGVWSDTAGTVVDSVITGGKVREGFNPVYGNASATIFNNCFSDTEVLNTKGLSGDPGYFNAAEGKYRPRSASPLVDQCGGSCALPKGDLRGKPRVFGKAADLGCYECQNFGLMLKIK